MKKILAILLAVTLLLSLSAVAFAEDLLIAPKPAEYNSMSGEIVSYEDGQLEVKDAASEETMIFYISEQTYLVDAETGLPADLQNRKTDSVVAYYGPAVTMSLPAKSPAIAVLVNVSEKGTTAFYAKAEKVTENEDGGIDGLCNNGTYLMTLDKDTAISAFKTKEIVTFEDIEEGDELVLWCGAITRSMPGQGHPEKAVLLGKAEVADDSGESKDSATLPQESQYNQFSGMVVGYEAGELEVKDANSEETMIFYIGEDTYVADAVNGTPAEIYKRTNDLVTVYYGPAVTASLPAKAPAIAVVLNMPENGLGGAFYTKVDQVSQNDEGVTELLCSNGSLILRPNDETTYAAFKTKNIVTLADIKEGSELLAWCDVIALSYPGQGTPTKFVVLSTPEENLPTPTSGEANDDTKISVSGTTVKVDGKEISSPAYEKGDTIMLPLRAIAEALGFEVIWNGDNSVQVVQGAQVGTLTIGDINYGFAKMIVKLDVAPELTDDLTYVPAEFFEEVLHISIAK